MTLEFVNAEVLTVGPDEVLIIRIPDTNQWDDGITSDLMDHLKSVGLEERSLVFVGEVELTKVTR